MKSRFASSLTSLFAIAFLFGCGDDVEDHHDHHPAPTVYESRILSDQGADGDIGFSAPSTFVISSAAVTGDVLAGIDPASGDEFRGFLDFPLGGAGGVPLDATVTSATLEIVIDSVAVAEPEDTIPMILDMVSFYPPTLRSSDFDRTSQPPLLSMPFIFFSSDAGNSVAIDVTPFMQEAQRRGLSDLQVRLLLDFSAVSGLIGIDDNAPATAPLLTVQYY